MEFFKEMSKRNNNKTGGIIKNSFTKTNKESAGWQNIAKKRKLKIEKKNY